MRLRPSQLREGASPVPAETPSAGQVDDPGSAQTLRPSSAPTPELETTIACGPPKQTNSPLLAGSLLANRYRVERELGRGGMGVVYQAHDQKLARGVALKVLHGDNRSPRARARIRREAQTAAGIRHPNVVNIFDIGQFGDSDYIAMELIDGVDLRTWLRQPELSWRNILEVFLAAGEGLCAAHTQGLVHRDFKPDNVLIEKSGRVRVLDFGLARPIAQEEAADVVAKLADTSNMEVGVVTRTGALVGTPAYMAPEQFHGKFIDARTDVFCFCVALHEALYGQRPYIAATVAELILQIESAEFVTPIPTRASRPPVGLLQLVLSGLTPSREARPELPELLDALRERVAPQARVWPRTLLAVALLGTVVAVAVSLAEPAEDLEVAAPPSQTDASDRAFAPSDAAPSEASFDAASGQRPQDLAAPQPSYTLTTKLGATACDKPWEMTLTGQWPPAAVAELRWRPPGEPVFTTIVKNLANTPTPTLTLPSETHQNRAIEYYVAVMDGEQAVASSGSAEAPNTVVAPSCKHPSRSSYRR
ncbi:MAG: protein kinase domain-containing protein, partial [Nannocystaceae bacterium]